MKTKKRKFKFNKPENSNFELQITALIDTLIIILIFMLKVTSLESLEIDQKKGLELPMVNDGSPKGTVEARLSINSLGLFWNGEQFIFTQNYKPTDKKLIEGQWERLAQAISNSSNKEKKVDKKFKLYLEADKNTPYSFMDKALKIARRYGYKDIRFIGAKYN